MITLWKSILCKKTTWMLILVIPLAIWFLVLPTAEETVNQVTVPIIIVDEFDQPLTDELMNDIEEMPFQIKKTDEFDLRPLVKGEAEAIFVMQENIEGRIQSGEIDEIITWYRNENSYVDGLFKEKLASAIMSRAVRAEAANLVETYQVDADWDEVYQYGTRYFEPEPIFQMNFETIGSAGSTEPRASDNTIFFPIIWLYVWLVIGYFTRFLYQWRDQGITERIELVGRSGWYYGSWLLFVLLISGILMLLPLNVIGMLDNTWIFLILAASILFYLLVALFVKKIQGLYVIAISYGIASFVVFMLAAWNLISESWMHLFIPTWFLI